MSRRASQVLKADGKPKMTLCHGLRISRCERCAGVASAVSIARSHGISHLPFTDGAPGTRYRKLLRGLFELRLEP